MNNIIKFFREHPKDLMNLIPKEKEETFYEKIRKVAYENFEKGKEVGLTKTQMIEICKDLNQKNIEVEKIDKAFVETKFGLMCMN